MGEGPSRWPSFDRPFGPSAVLRTGFAQEGLRMDGSGDGGDLTP